MESAETAAQKTQAARLRPESSQPAPIPEEQQSVLNALNNFSILAEYQRSLGSPNIASDSLQTIVARMEEHNRFRRHSGRSARWRQSERASTAPCHLGRRSRKIKRGDYS
jgi:hypothetical protein